MVDQLAENFHNITIILSLHLLRKLIITALLTVVCKSTSFILNYLLTVDVYLPCLRIIYYEKNK